MKIDDKELNKIIDLALSEDIGGGDITSLAVIPDNSISEMFFITREDIVVCGLSVLESICRKSDLLGQAFLQDGMRAGAGEKLYGIKGSSRKILGVERVALNLIQRMCGIATITSKYVAAVKGTGVKILDTRKTLPVLRILDKYSVRIGGGTNHRMGLYDRILIKDNHIAIAGSVKEAMSRAKKFLMIYHSSLIAKIEIECDNLTQVSEALENGADIILLDNMKPEELRKAVRMRGEFCQGKKILPEKQPLLEASGGINLTNVRQIAETGVDFISIGALTHSVKAADIGGDFV